MVITFKITLISKSQTCVTNEIDISTNCSLLLSMDIVYSKLRMFYNQLKWLFLHYNILLDNQI